MIKYIAVICLLLQNDCRDKYLSRVLESRNYNYYYVVVKAQLNNDKKDILILNNNLYKYIKSKNKNLTDIKKYKLM
jgi:hypothetical protein